MKQQEAKQAGIVAFIMKSMEMAIEPVRRAQSVINMAFTWLLIAGFLLGLVYFVWYVFYGYDDSSRVHSIRAIGSYIDLSYFPIGENGPFFAFNLFLAFFVIFALIATLIGLCVREISIALAKYNKSYFDHAILLIYDGGEYRFSWKKFGWAETIEASRLANVILGVIVMVGRNIPFPTFKRLYEKTLGYLVLTLRYDRMFNDLTVAETYMAKIDKSDQKFAESRYHLALIKESLAIDGFLTQTPKLLKEAIKWDVDLAEFQLGMFLIQYADRLSNNGYETRREGVDLLKKALVKAKPDRVDIKNMCCITIANCLAESDDASDLAYAILILESIDYSDKKTIKVEDNEAFVKNCQSARSRESREFRREATRLAMNNIHKPHRIPKNRRYILGSYISLSELSKRLALKLDIARKKELYIAIEEEKRKATENLMAMFAHKFRGPVDSIIFNTQHKHDERIYLDAARTMTGLLEVFSIVSTESETLVDSMKSDVGGGGSPEKAILRSLKLALMQLLTQRTIKRMSRHYWQHALRHRLIPDSTSFKDWNSQPHLSILEKEIQEKLEMEVSALSIEHGVEDIETWMRTNLMATEIRVSDARCIRFSEYGRKEALLITIMTELFVNAIKHRDPTSPHPLTIHWAEQEKAVVFKCTNPSNRESRSGLSRGSGRGHSFLKLLLEKMNGQFQADVYQELSSVYVEIPYDLLIGETT